MRYVASLVSGVGIFFLGAGLSFYHGIMGILTPESMESLYWVSIVYDDTFKIQFKISKSYG